MDSYLKPYTLHLLMEFATPRISLPACASRLIISSLSKPTTMKPEMILQADLLDIVFDNRNKEYGAYELRSHYERRLKKSLSIIFISIAVLILSVMVKGYFFPNSHSSIFDPIIPETTITPIDLTPPPIRPKALSHSTKRYEQIAVTKPLITRAEVTKTAPTINDISDKIISNKEVSGDKLLLGDPVQPNANVSGSGSTVKSEANAEEAKPLEVAEVMPQFPGGVEALKRFLVRNLRMPEGDMEAGMKVNTLVRFVVDKDGTVTGIVLEKSGGKDFDKEVERVIRKMPTWIPGKQNGRNVDVYFHLPVIFQVSE